MALRWPRSFVGTDLTALLARVALGLVFLYHGFALTFQGGHSHIAELMTSKGAPMPDLLGWLAALTQFFGGGLILVGFLSRLWGLGLAVVMAVAAAIVHWPNGWSIQNNGIEFTVVLGLLALGVFVGGPGVLSLDRLFFGRQPRSRVPASHGDSPPTQPSSDGLRE